MISSSEASQIARLTALPVRTAIEADDVSETSRVAAPILARLWIPAVAASMLYPFAVRWFVAGFHAAESSGGAPRLIWSAGALLMLALAVAPPLLALRSLYELRLARDPGTAAVRRLLHLAVTVPPLYLVWIRIAGGMNALVGNTTSGLISWDILWIALGVLTWNVYRRESGDSADSSARSTTLDPAARTAATPDAARDGEPASLWSSLTGRARKVHRFAVVAILASFLILHLTNHLFALWSVPAQRTVMLALRTWYRAIWVEPLILALFVVAALSGLTRLGRLTRSPADGFRVLQTASGAYLAVFLVSHIWATLGARFHGIDTDWAFASGGRAGMLASGVAAAVLLYYVFALFAVAVHAGLGLRMVLLSRRVRAVAANRAARLTAAFGSAISVLIIAALLGARLAG